MKVHIIPDVKLEIGENLYLKFGDVEYTIGAPAYTSGLPEDCHDGEASEVDWKDENVKLVIEKIEYDLVLGRTYKKGERPASRIVEVEYSCEPALAVAYYDELLEFIEEG